jgi:hypothetical protein
MRRASTPSGRGWSPSPPRPVECEKVNRVLLDEAFPRYADVLAADEWIAGLER